MVIPRSSLRRQRCHDHSLYTFEGLTIKTDKWDRKEDDRVLVLGGAVHVLMNYMYHHPELVKDKYFFEPFAGSGPLGLLALELGARHSDLQDINPRAVQFIRENATGNGFDASRYSAIEENIRTFRPKQKYDVLFANPPFAPVPDGVGMPIHSNGGADGNALTEALLSKLDDLLKPQGEAFLTVFQIEDRHGPTVLPNIKKHIPSRHVELTRMRSKSFDFAALVHEYTSDVPHKRQEVIAWSERLKEQYGECLSFNYYVVHIGKEHSTPAPCTLRDYDGKKYGEGFYNFDPEDNLIGVEIHLFVEK